MNQKILINIFDNLEVSLENEMAIKIQHNLEDGKYREYLVKKVLSKIVPSKYAITNGFIIDSNDMQSDEMDIIIYDKSYVPPFFDETYTVVPIEAVIAVIQVKTTLNKKQLNNAIENLNSIDRLTAKIGGKIISANRGDILTEQRYVAPYKIIIAYRSKLAKKYDFTNDMKSKGIDMVYTINGGHDLYIKHRNEPKGVVNLNKKELDEIKNNGDIEKIHESKLCNFALQLLDKMKLINNALIINYKEYIKGAK